MEKYEPELGQFVYGQPYKEFECSESIECVLRTIRDKMEETHIGEHHGYTPFDNSGMSYKNEVFEVNAYDWNEDNAQLFNFKWKDFEVSWYKYLGRGMSQNREITYPEIDVMLNECLQSIK